MIHPTLTCTECGSPLELSTVTFGGGRSNTAWVCSKSEARPHTMIDWNEQYEREKLARELEAVA